MLEGMTGEVNKTSVWARMAARLALASSFVSFSGSGLGSGEPFTSAAAAFAALAADYGAFAGLSYEKIGLTGAVSGAESGATAS